MIEVELVDGPKDGVRLPFPLDEAPRTIVLPGRRNISPFASDGPHPLVVEHVYQLNLDHGHPSRTDDGAYRYRHSYDR